MNSLIESLNAWGTRLLELAPVILWQSSLLIAIVFAIDFAFRRKLRAAIRYALWLVVLVKLLLPPTLALPTGAAWWLRSRPILTSPPIVRPVKVTYANSITSEPDPEPAPAAAAPPPPAPHLTKSGWMLMTSASISVLLFAWLIFRWVQIVQLVRRASPASQVINDLLQEIKPRTKLSRDVQVRLTSDPMSPAVCGLFQPVVLLPQSLVEKLGPEQLRAVLLHELIHLRRLDVWVNFVQSLLQISYWWHPLLWLANARIRRVREEAVDDAVMLTLREDSEVYAPTLLEVAKLAFNRPLASLGLVGILESKNALRQRIERLLNNTPRRAGLSIVSIFGIAAFTALAVPMAEGPARIIDAGGGLDSANSINLMPFHAKVNPEVFIRNLKARAGETMHTTNDSLNDILLSVVDGLGIDCTPPRAIALNSRTGEVTAQNTPEALQRLDEVIKELNLPGGEHIINPPYGVKQVSITAHIYQMRSADFARLDLDDTKSQKQPNASPSWDLTSNQADEVMQKINDLGIQTMSSPQVRTFHGCTAEMSIIDQTNNSRIDFQCRPSIGEGTVFLSVLARTTGKYAPDGHGWPDFAGWTNCAIFTRVGVPDGSGVLLESGHPGYMPDSKLVVLLRVKIINPPATASQPAAISTAELVQAGKLQFQLGKMDEAEAKFQRVLKSEPVNQAALYYLDLISQNRAKIDVASTNRSLEAQNIPNARLPRDRNIVEAVGVYTSPGRREVYSKLNSIILDEVSYSKQPLPEVIKDLARKTEAQDPAHEGMLFILSKNMAQSTIDPQTLQPGSPAPPSLSDSEVADVKITLEPHLKHVRLADVLEAITKSADHPIKYSLMDYGIEFSLRGPDVPELFTRLFKIDPNTVLTHLNCQIPSDTNGAALQSVQSDFHRAFTNAGFNLAPPRSVFFNYLKGTITFRATADELDDIENWLIKINQAEAINSSPTARAGASHKSGASAEAATSQNPQRAEVNIKPRSEVSIKARFVEISAVRDSAGKIHAMDSDFTSTLKKLLAANTNLNTNQSDALTGILTESQMKDVLKVLQKTRHGSLLNEGEVTTLSERQAAFQIVNVMTIVNGLKVDIKDSPTTAVNETNYNYQTTNMDFGVTLDVMPTIAKDKSSVSMTVIPRITEFLGYQKPDELSDYDKNLKRAQFPLPHWRERRMSTAVTVPDRQTLVLGGLSDDIVNKHLDGSLSRKEFSNPPYKTYKQLLVFVTATIIDTTGNPTTTVTKNSFEYPLHSENYYDSPVWGGFGGGGGGFGGGAPMLR